MKKVHSTSDSIEANMIAAFLNNEGIRAWIRNEHSLHEIGQPYEVCIDDTGDQQKAEEIILDIMEKQTSPEVTKKGFSGNSFIYGLISGVALMFLLTLVAPDAAMRQGAEYKKDLNGDGKPDVWFEYSGSQVSKEIMDSDFNGTRDTWYYYSMHGLLESAEFDNNNDGKLDTWQIYTPRSGMLSLVKYDMNYDGKPDMWEYYDNNHIGRYEADNDWDGRRDNWGVFLNGVIQESMWSYRQDGVVTRKDLFRHGVLYKALFDLDSDGTFDEQASYDEFEREIKREKLRNN